MKSLKIALLLSTMLATSAWAAGVEPSLGIAQGGTGGNTATAARAALSAAASGANGDITSLTALTSANINGAASSTRPLNWQSSGTTIWSFRNQSSDSVLGLYAYNPSGGAFIGAPLQFTSSGTPTIARGWFENVGVSTAAAASAIIGINEVYTNTGGQGAQGKKLGYFSNAGNAAVAGFDLGNTELANWNSAVFPTSGQMGMELDWRVGLSPSATGSWSMAMEEFDVVNRQADHGYTHLFGMSNGITGLLMVPETQTFGQLNSTGVTGNTYNADAALMIAPSGAVNTNSGFKNKWYNGLQCGQDSLVGQYGRCIVANGDNTSTPSQNPGSPLAAYNAFVNGIDTAQATFVTNLAFRGGAGQTIGLSDGSVIGATVTSGGGGTGYGASVTGTLTWSGSGNYACSTNPLLNVTTNSSGVITTINSVTTPGVCAELPAPYAQMWTAGGGLSAGSGAEITLKFNVAGIGSTGAGLTLAATLISNGAVQAQAGTVAGANVPIVLSGGVSGGANAQLSVASGAGFVLSLPGEQFYVNFPSNNIIAATATNTTIGAFSGDVVLGSGSALITGAAKNFLSIPFMNGAPTSTPTYSGGPSLVWNSSSKTLDVYDAGAAAWYHLTAATAGAS